jgi:hypothetical protein
MDDLMQGAADLVINHLLAEVEFFTVKHLECILKLGQCSGLPTNCLADDPRGVVRSAIRNRLDQICGKLIGIVNRPQLPWRLHALGPKAFDDVA